MAEIIRKRLTGKEEGFTLIELLVVIVILGILMAIAVPSYMGFRERAQRSAAQANVRAALPSIEAYYQDHDMYADDAPAAFTVAFLQGNYDAGLKLTTVASVDAGDSYCISNLQGTDKWAYKQGPDGQITQVDQAADPCAVAAP